MEAKKKSTPSAAATAGAGAGAGAGAAAPPSGYFSSVFSSSPAVPCLCHHAVFRTHLMLVLRIVSMSPFVVIGELVVRFDKSVIEFVSFFSHMNFDLMMEEL